MLPHRDQKLAQVLGGDQFLILQPPQHDAWVAALALCKGSDLLFREVGLGGSDKLPQRLRIDQPVSGQAICFGLDRVAVLFVASTMELIVGFQVEPKVSRRAKGACQLQSRLRRDSLAPLDDLANRLLWTIHDVRQVLLGPSSCLQFSPNDAARRWNPRWPWTGTHLLLPSLIGDSPQ